jgi:argininosuccinate lyase
MKLWGSRFTKETDNLVVDFHSSISFDQRLYAEDIAGSIAHASMLERIGILSREEGEMIRSGLAEIMAEAAEGRIT